MARVKEGIFDSKFDKCPVEQSFSKSYPLSLTWQDEDLKKKKTKKKKKGALSLSTWMSGAGNMTEILNFFKHF